MLIGHHVGVGDDESVLRHDESRAAGHRHFPLGINHPAGGKGQSLQRVGNWSRSRLPDFMVVLAVKFDVDDSRRDLFHYVGDEVVLEAKTVGVPLTCWGGTNVRDTVTTKGALKGTSRSTETGVARTLLP